MNGYYLSISRIRDINSLTNDETYVYTSLNITDVSDTLQISPCSPYGLRLGKHSVDDPSLHLLINSLATRVTFETNSISRPYDYCFYDPLKYG